MINAILIIVIAGDWIQAVSRKDKKKQVKKDEPKDIPSSPKKVAENKIKEKEKETTIDHEEDTILKEAQVQVQSQTTQTTPKPTPEKKPKKVAKDVSTTTGFSAPSSQESTPVKQKQAVEKENVVEKTPPQVVAVNGVTESSKQSLEASPTKKQSISEDSPTSTETKGHVAFDEMGGGMCNLDDLKCSAFGDIDMFGLLRLLLLLPSFRYER